MNTQKCRTWYAEPQDTGLSCTASSYSYRSWYSKPEAHYRENQLAKAVGVTVKRV